MKQKVYSVYNRKIGAYNPPFFTNEEPDQVFTGMVRYCKLNEERALQEHWDEAELYYCGEFDDITGEIISVKPGFIGTFADLFVGGSKNGNV